MVHASVRLAGRTVLSDLSFEIAPGEFVACIGPNGAGKSTLLRGLLGLIPLSAGTAQIFGRTSRRGNRDVGFVPQHGQVAVSSPLRARDMLSLGIDGARYGIPLPSADRSRRIDAALADVRATHYADAPMSRLSGGEQQRLMLAQALIGRPRLLLLDEPLANLDIRSRGEVVDLVARASRERNLAVIFVAHDVNPLLRVVDRVLYLADGRGVIGSADEVISERTLSALFGFPIHVFRAEGYVMVAGMDQGEHCHPHA
jgi:zinc/manganese transport system ATP-binding protein